MQHSEPQSFLGDTVRLDYALNPGGFLSLGSNLGQGTRFCMFIGFGVCTMIGVAIFLIVKWDSRLVVFVSLVYIFGGGIGNLIDRVSNNGLVTDFLNVGVGPIRSGIFNVADVGVMFGAIVLMVAIHLQPKPQPERD